MTDIRALARLASYADFIESGRSGEAFSAKQIASDIRDLLAALSFAEQRLENAEDLADGRATRISLLEQEIVEFMQDFPVPDSESLFKAYGSVSPDAKEVRPGVWVAEKSTSVFPSPLVRTEPAEELPKRSAVELVNALRVRADYVSGHRWEAPATAAMMREAADVIEQLSAALVRARAPQDPPTP
jgi:hypothetical protein